MALQIIGAGFGRTGTLSLKAALEQLGFNPCYHMVEVFAHPEHIDLWADAVHGRGQPWDALFTGYQAAVDWPACSWWQDLAAHWPQAKVILSLRDPEAWHASVMNTIYRSMQAPGDSTSADPGQRHLANMRKLIIDDTFGGRLADRDHAIAVFNAHNAAVRRALPPERLLVFDAREGWEPLCRFLGVPVPATPYPKTNSTEEFQARRLRD